MITLVQFPRYNGFPNMSPFCLKLETYLRMAQIPYEVKSSFDFKQAPKGKMPYIIEDGVKIADSAFIIEHLMQKFGDKVEVHLTDLERAQNHAFIKMLEEDMVPMGVYMRWVDEQVWPQFRQVLFGKMKFPLNKIVPPMLHKRMKRRMWDRGVGRHSRQEILHLADQDLHALSLHLGNKKFFSGDKPCLLDAACFGLVGNMVYENIQNPLTPLAKKYSNLVAHSEMMFKTYFAELWEKYRK